MGSHTASGLGRRSELSLGVSRLLIASVACRSGSTSFVRDRPPATLERTLVENWFRRAEAEMAQMIMRRVAHLTIATVFLCAAFSTSAAQPQPNSRSGIHVLDYAITIDVPDSGPSINGDATLKVQRSDGVDTLTLDLIKLHVVRVTIDGRETTFARTDSTIVIPLSRETGTSFTTRVVYDGPVTDGLIAHRDSAGRWTYFGDNWPNRARYWIPSIDLPSEKATVSWTITAPVGQTIVANGLAIENRVLPMAQRRRQLSRWRESRPIAPYLMVIAVAPLVKFDLGQTACGLAELARCVPQSVYVAPEQR